MDFGQLLKYVIERIFIPLCNWTPTFFGIPINLPMVLLWCAICWCLGVMIRCIVWLWWND